MIFSITISIFLASVARIISIEAGIFNQANLDDDDAKPETADYVKVIDDTPDELMWFVQVSVSLDKVMATSRPQQKQHK